MKNLPDNWGKTTFPGLLDQNVLYPQFQVIQAPFAMAQPVSGVQGWPVRDVRWNGRGYGDKRERCRGPRGRRRLSLMAQIQSAVVCLGVAAFLSGYSLANAAVVHVSFSTEISRTWEIPPWEQFPNGSVATAKTIASGSFVFNSDGLGDLERFMGVLPKIHLENQLFYDNEDWTQLYLKNEGLIVTATDWSIDLAFSTAGLYSDGTFGFGFVARGTEPANRGFRAAGSRMPPLRLDYLYVGSNISDWRFHPEVFNRSNVPVVSSYSVSEVPEPSSSVLFAIGFLGLITMRSRVL